MYRVIYDSNEVVTIVIDSEQSVTYLPTANRTLKVIINTLSNAKTALQALSIDTSKIDDYANENNIALN